MPSAKNEPVMSDPQELRAEPRVQEHIHESSSFPGQPHSGLESHSRQAVLHWTDSGPVDQALRRFIHAASGISAAVGRGHSVAREELPS